ncbi:MAG: hypothetical protein HKN19_09330 [Halioglobus sp.]|nr:hypothetical protein [Halioglobus sp.]
MQSNVARAFSLILFFLWLPGAALAQPQEQETQEQETQEQQPVEDVTVEAGEQAQRAPQTDAQQERSPHDYRPSEDISEDLSVSFPVDI